MAGIAGAVASSPWASQPLLEEMAQSLRYSRTSSVEAWHNDRAGLCHVRTGVDHSARQPLLGTGEAKRIVFFGECFGYDKQKRDLDRRGHAFEHGDSDAEFVLHFYEEFGDKSLPLLSGSFSFAVYDSAAGELILANDRLGSRPLFYGIANDGKLVFATQVASVLCSSDISRDLDVAAAVEFCTLQKVLGDKTYHRGVKMLPPASILRFRGGRLAITQYWQPEYRPQPGSRSEYAEELAATMRRAMRHITRGDGRVGVLLSGGLDARMMVAAAESDLSCYTFADYQNPEFHVAQRVAAAKGFHLHFLERDRDHYANICETAVELGNGMHPFNHAHALGFVDAISETCGAVTHGYGIEALFRGTTLPRRPRSSMGMSLGVELDPSLTEVNLPDRLYRRDYSLLGKYPNIFARPVAEQLEENIVRSARDFLASTAARCATVYDKLLLSDVFQRCRYTGYLFLLSLRPYIIERSVLFNNEVIDLHLRTPLEYRHDDGTWLKAMARLDSKVAHVINANTGHSPFTPPALLQLFGTGRRVLERLRVPRRFTRRRQGLLEPPGHSPISWPRFEWQIRNNSKLRQLIIDTLGDPEAFPPDLFNIPVVQAILADHLANRGQHRFLLFALLTFGRWHKRHGKH